VAGEVKVAGRAVPAGPVVTNEEAGETAEGESFVADITEVVITHLDDAATMLVVEWWTPAHGVQVVERA
jgi:hypothetical protein